MTGQTTSLPKIATTHQQHEQALESGDDHLLTIREVSRHLRVDDTTTRRWIRGGVLEAIVLPHRGKRQAYRIKRSVLHALLEGPHVQR